jgi:hypothetical protein
MLSTFLRSPTYDWLVVGSNGSIGSEITHGLSKSFGKDQISFVFQCAHPRHQFSEACQTLLRNHSMGGPLRVIFSAGRGGFSLDTESALQQRLEFEQFCRSLTSWRSLDRFVLISSLGAHCSQIQSPYQELIFAKEQSVLEHFGQQGLILRLPSMYGWNRHAQRYHGLIGILLRQLRQRLPANVYARMETRRNYLSVNGLVSTLISQSVQGPVLGRRGIVNIQAATNLSIFDVCASFFRATRHRPVLRLLRPLGVDAEHHFPSLVGDASVAINDSVEAWIKWQWRQSYRALQS